MSKNKLSRALGARWNRDTNPVAHGLVVDRGTGEAVGKTTGAEN
jgi:hypothetical protein